MGVPLSQARFELMGFYYTTAMGAFNQLEFHNEMLHFFWNAHFLARMSRSTSALKHLLYLAGLYFPYDWLQTILVGERCREAVYRQPESFSLKKSKNWTRFLVPSRASGVNSSVSMYLQSMWSWTSSWNLFPGHFQEEDFHPGWQ